LFWRGCASLFSRFFTYRQQVLHELPVETRLEKRDVGCGLSFPVVKGERKGSPREGEERKRTTSSSSHQAVLSFLSFSLREKESLPFHQKER